MNLSPDIEGGFMISKLNGYEPDFVDVLMNPAIISLYKRAVRWKSQVRDRISVEFTIDPTDSESAKISHVRIPDKKKIIPSKLVQKIMSEKLECSAVPHQYDRYMDADILGEMYEGVFLKKYDYEILNITDFKSIRVVLSKNVKSHKPEVSLLKALELLQAGKMRAKNGGIESDYDDEILNYCPSHMLGFVRDLGIPALRYNLVNR